MKKLIIFFLILSTNILKGQKSITNIYGNYCLKDSSWRIYKLKLTTNNQFEFIYDSNDCTSDYTSYGKGQFEIGIDSITLNFDSIPNRRSSHTIDSVDNADNSVNIQLRVINEDLKALTNIDLIFGKNKKQRLINFKKNAIVKFDSIYTINLQKSEKIYFMNIEKDGYYTEYLGSSKIRTKDYFIEVVLRPKPNIPSLDFISNSKEKFRIMPDSSIELYENSYLKKENCN